MNKKDEDLELDAIREIYSALKALDEAAQNRVLDYVSRRLSLNRDPSASSLERHEPTTSLEPRPQESAVRTPEKDPANEDIEGISPIALKWMRRSGLTSAQLSTLFSLGIDEIDLVAKSVPGKSKAERVHSVLLLLGVAGYLSSGAARITDEKLREACGHYDAYDVTNFSKHIKAVSAEVSGTKEGGYSLTSRGLSAATELIKAITTASK